MIGFMGTESFPRLAEETWWTNDRHNQSEIWGKTNFFHSSTRHTGIVEYSKIINASIEKELNCRIPSNEMSTVHFELTGHSSGGMLATLSAFHLRNLSPASIHAFLFATPSFLTRAQGLELSAQFNNSAHARYSLFNIISHDDPALAIYGPRFIPPEKNTVYILNENFKHSFLGVYAASKRTTLDNIEHHMISNYQKIVTKLLEQMEDVLPSTDFSISPRQSKL
ncbi:MAG: hypothetical protein H0U75_07815 [Legionella sp.]|nr:hypothetical protein [Legionella sp.]